MGNTRAVRHVTDSSDWSGDGADDPIDVTVHQSAKFVNSDRRTFEPEICG